MAAWRPGRAKLHDGWLRTCAAETRGHCLRVRCATLYCITATHGAQLGGLGKRAKAPDWMPADLVYAAGLGKQRLIVTREKGLTIVRLAKDTATFEDEQFLSWLARGKAAD